MRDALEQVIAETVPELRRLCREPWQVIGSAAAALAGAQVSVADLDLLTGADDAARLTEAWRDRRETGYEPAGAGHFRSRFARFRFTGMPVEVMGALALNAGQGWQAVAVRQTVLVRVAGLEVPIPSVPEQIRILESFARPKDLHRAALLRALAASAG